MATESAGGTRFPRRNLLVAAAALTLPLPPTATASGDPAAVSLLLSGCYVDDRDDRRAGIRWQNPGGPGDAIDLGFRVHQILPDPARPRRFLAFARRPGTRIVDVQLGPGTPSVRQVKTGRDRHLYGHGAFSADGRHVYTSENNFETGDGRIVVRDAETLSPVQEWSSGGVGPHEIALAEGGRMLAVANGGIRTHPAMPRRKLNLDSMRPNLAYLDTATGRLLERRELGERRSSIRHLDVWRDHVVTVQQHEGPRSGTVPLVCLHRRGESLRPLAVETGEFRRMNWYTASVAVHEPAGTALVTCPRGNVVTLWDLRELRLIRSLDVRQPFGAVRAVDADGFLITTATGAIYDVGTEGEDLTLVQTARAGTAWDNHLSWLGQTT